MSVPCRPEGYYRHLMADAAPSPWAWLQERCEDHPDEIRIPAEHWDAGFQHLCRMQRLAATKDRWSGEDQSFRYRGTIVRRDPPADGALMNILERTSGALFAEDRG